MTDQMPTQRFLDYCSSKEQAAARALLSPLRTIASPGTSAGGLVPIGNKWTSALFDGMFWRSEPPDAAVPTLSVVFVQSRDGNTGDADPAALGGGDTDKHFLYEGLSRIDADAVMAGAATAREEALIFSVWHPELVALRRQRRRTRHPAQVVVTARGDLPFESALLFSEPEIVVFVITSTPGVAGLQRRLRERHWITVIDAGVPLSLRAGLSALRHHGICVISAVGGRHTATALLREDLVDDLYVTTSAVEGGEPGTPFYSGPPLDLRPVLTKEGTGRDVGMTFDHFRINRRRT